MGSNKSGEGDRDLSLAVIGAAPLHHDWRLIHAFDDGAAARRAAVGDEQVDRSLHPQEARCGYSERLREHALEGGFSQAERIDQPVEGANQVVFRVIDRFGRNGAGIVPRVLGLLSRKAERILQHFGKVVPHQQRFVLINGETGKLLAGTEAKTYSAFLDAVLR